MLRRPVISEAAKQLHEDCLVFDLHCDTLLNQSLLGYDVTKRHTNRLPLSPFLFHADIPRMKEGGIGAVALGLVVNPLRKRSALDATRRALGQVRGWEQSAPDDVSLVSTADDIEAARAAGKLAVFGGLEGAHGLGGHVEPLPELRAKGLRYVGLSHFSKNLACTPALGWRSNNVDPLTDHGRDLIDGLCHERILVDLAHINKPGFLEAATRATRPVIVSHTGVRGAHDVWRNIDDDQLRAVADTGGVVCIIFAPVFLSAGLRGTCDGVVKHIQHVINTVGEDHVGIGTDLDGFVVPPKDFPDISHMPRLTHLMLEAGMKEQTIRKALGANMLRTFREVCG
ncbi:MAG: peptidase [Proteobacteria bacterium]|nr:peptidase [Pseudomonadota bacterium]